MNGSLKLGAMAVLVAVGSVGCTTAVAAPEEQQEELSTSNDDVTARKINYLALGDSIAFGFDPTNTNPANPNTFRGYPEVIDTFRFIHGSNAACPGETSGSFLSDAAADNGCRNWKAAFSLHDDYEGTQIDFALAFLQRTETKYVSINVGANDLLLLQKTCLGDPKCIQAALPATLGAYGKNLGTIYARLRGAGFSGKLVGLTTYVPNYNDPLAVGAFTALNQVLTQVTTAAGGEVADGFGAFKFVAQRFGGDSCAAGLLITLPDGTCDIHPSRKGRDILAAAVLGAALR
jgi:lysophospholipase L1-like esterase